MTQWQFFAWTLALAPVTIATITALAFLTLWVVDKIPSYEERQARKWDKLARLYVKQGSGRTANFCELTAEQWRRKATK